MLCVPSTAAGLVCTGFVGGVRGKYGIFINICTRLGHITCTFLLFPDLVYNIYICIMYALERIIIYDFYFDPIVSTKKKKNKNHEKNDDDRFSNLYTHNNASHVVVRRISRDRCDDLYIPNRITESI